MTDTTDRPTLSASDVALMRQIITWRKANGIRLAWTHGVWIDDKRRMTGRRAVTRDEHEVGFVNDYDRERMQWLPAASLTQAVDVLVAYGYLPARFSSAYRAGWEACDAWRLGPPRISGPDGNDLRPAQR